MNMTALTWIELPRILLCCAQSVVTWHGPSGSCGQLLVQLSRSLPARERRRTWVSSFWHQKLYVCGGGFLQLHRAACTVRERRKMMLLEAKKLQVCAEAALLFCCAPRVFQTHPVLSSTGCSHCWRRSLGSVCSTRLWHFIISSYQGLWRFTVFCLGKCSVKTYRTTVSYSDSCDTEVKKNTWVDSLEKRYFCHLKTW